MDSYLDPPLPPPYQRRGDRTFQKLIHLGGGGGGGEGVPNFLPERGDNPGRGVATFLLLYNSIQYKFTVCVWEK